MSITQATNPDLFQARRQRVGTSIAGLVIAVYTLMCGLFIYRLTSSPVNTQRIMNLTVLLVSLAANIAALVWLRQGRLTLSAWTFIIVNTVMLLLFALTSPNNNAVMGVAVALALGTYASATLPRRRVALGVLIGFIAGAIVSAADYLQFWQPGRIDLSDTALPVLAALIVILIAVLVRLYAGFPLGAKLLLASAGIALFAAVGIFAPVYAVLQATVDIPPALSQSIEGTLVVAGGVIVILSSLASQIIAQAITRPLQTVARASDNVAAGDLHALSQTAAGGAALSARLVQIEQQSQDEISDLARAFNQLLRYQWQTVETAKQLAVGDLTVTIVPQSEQDVLGQAFAQMVVNLKDLVGAVATNAQQLRLASNTLAEAATRVDGSAHQVNATMQDVAQGISQQTESISKTSASVELVTRAIDGVALGAQEQANSVGLASTIMGQLSAAVEGIRQGAGAQGQATERASLARASLAAALQQVGAATEQVAAEAQQAAHSAAAGAGIAEQTVAGIQKVSAATGQLAERVRGLGQQSAHIGTIVETIDEIASQTNLLALNAAIEAARAGDQGKGFAVVADEVRKLAERSASATKEIAAMIRTIQSEASDAVQAMAQTDAGVNAAVKLTGQAGMAFREIAEKSQVSANRMRTVNNAVDAMRRADGQLETDMAVALTITRENQQAADSMGRLNQQMVESLDRVSAVVEENTASTEEMAAGAAEVSRAIETIAAVSEENSAATEEVSASAQEMADQVQAVSTAARALARMAEALQALVTQFRLDEPSLESLGTTLQTLTRATRGQLPAQATRKA